MLAGSNLIAQSNFPLVVRQPFIKNEPDPRPNSFLMKGKICAAFCVFALLPRGLASPGSAGRKATSYARVSREQRVALDAQTAPGAPSARIPEIVAYD